VETFSDVPIRFSKPIRQRLLQFPKASKKGLAGTLGLLKGLKLKDLAPEAPSIQNFTTGEVMVSFVHTIVMSSVFYITIHYLGPLQ
jgi:acetyl-CoA acyltransferase